MVTIPKRESIHYVQKLSREKLSLFFTFLSSNKNFIVKCSIYNIVLKYREAIEVLVLFMNLSLGVKYT